MSSDIRKKTITVAALPVSLLLCPLALADAGVARARPENTPGSLAEAISGGKAQFEFRYRFEHVDQDGVAEKAKASTLKSRINFETLEFHRSSLFLEVDNVSYLGDDDFNNFRNNNTQYPVVADPDGAHVNQAYLNLNGSRGYLRLGRQRINVNNQRFVGGVAWRQNEQTLDALSLHAEPSGKVEVDYHYALRVSRIFGPDNGEPDDSLDSNAHILNLSFTLPANARLSAYAYALDLEDADAQSNRTLGLRLNHAFKAQSLSIPLTLEYAHQQDHGDNPVSYDAAYYLLETGIDKDQLRLRAGFEVFEGDRNQPNRTFRTPLGTLHKFQGWSDKFLSIPQAGVEDTYLSFQYRSFLVAWHDFESEASAASLGSEWNLSWSYQFNEHYSVLLKYADYQADELATDTRKAWLMFTAKF